MAARRRTFPDRTRLSLEAVLVPASALKLQFGPEGLADWGYHPIVLGLRR